MKNLLYVSFVLSVIAQNTYADTIEDSVAAQRYKELYIYNICLIDMFNILHMATERPTYKPIISPADDIINGSIEICRKHLVVAPRDKIPIAEGLARELLNEMFVEIAAIREARVSSTTK